MNVCLGICAIILTITFCIGVFVCYCIGVVSWALRDDFRRKWLFSGMDFDDED